MGNNEADFNWFAGSGKATLSRKLSKKVNIEI